MGARLKDVSQESKDKLPGPGNYDHTSNNGVFGNSPTTKFGLA